MTKEIPLLEVPQACHRCDAPPAHIWLRDATEQEAAAIVAEIRRHRSQDLHLPGELTYQAIARMYGPARMPVFGCAEHDLAPAPVDDSADAAAAAAQAGLERRALVHGPDCGGHGTCDCPPTS